MNELRAVWGAFWRLVGRLLTTAGRAVEQRGEGLMSEREG